MEPPIAALLRPLKLPSVLASMLATENETSMLRLWPRRSRRLLQQYQPVMSRPSTLQLLEEQLDSDCGESHLRQLCLEALGVFVELDQVILVPHEDFPYKALSCHLDGVPNSARRCRLRQLPIERPNVTHSSTTPTGHL
jgi:hypothetical protein